jgi:hypothetical protein
MTYHVSGKDWSRPSIEVSIKMAVEVNDMNPSIPVGKSFDNTKSEGSLAAKKNWSPRLCADAVCKFSDNRLDAINMRVFKPDVAEIPRHHFCYGANIADIRYPDLQVA